MRNCELCGAWRSNADFRTPHPMRPGYKQRCDTCRRRRNEAARACAIQGYQFDESQDVFAPRRVSRGPLAAYLRSLPQTPKEIAAQLGVNVSSVYQYQDRKGNYPTMLLTTVDTILTRLDNDVSLYDIYPELYR